MKFVKDNKLTLILLAPNQQVSTKVSEIKPVNTVQTTKAGDQQEVGVGIHEMTLHSQASRSGKHDIKVTASHLDEVNQLANVEFDNLTKELPSRSNEYTFEKEITEQK